MYNFFALLSRMKYIDRWALMRNSRHESISEHSLEVAMIAHALAVIGNCYLGKSHNPERLALLGLYHDATEIITGDMPTPVKYKNSALKKAYKDMEAETAEKMAETLPAEMRDFYAPVLKGAEGEEKALLHAADKLSAYIKCIEEEKSGNTEFSSAKASIYKKLTDSGMKEVELFLQYFIEGYGKTLDELWVSC